MKTPSDGPQQTRLAAQRVNKKLGRERHLIGAPRKRRHVAGFVVRSCRGLWNELRARDEKSLHFNNRQGPRRAEILGFPIFSDCLLPPVQRMGRLTPSTISSQAG